MTKGLLNWNFKEVENFLKSRGFRLNHIKGSHHFYIKVANEILRKVCVPRHNTEVLKPRTLKGIIAQSGIAKEEWLAD